MSSDRDQFSNDEREEPTDQAGTPSTNENTSDHIMEPGDSDVPPTAPPILDRGFQWPVGGHRELAIDSEKYRVIKKLGGGGMGAVWLVEHKKLVQKRAIKVIRAEAASEPGHRARFEREAQILARLVHPNAVVLHDFAIVGDVAYIDMEYLEGDTLRTWIAQGEPLPLPKVDWLLREICEVIAHAHDQGIVHRDIKPENIMILTDPKSGREWVKVLDFGIAKIVENLTNDATGVPPSAEASVGADQDGDFEKSEDDGKGATHTSILTTGIVGTLAYASPEQLGRELDTKLEPRIDRRTDIYSIGVLLYELLTGTRPFSGATAKLLHDQRHTLPPRFSVTAPGVDIDPVVEKVVLECLEKRPDKRPQSARALYQQFHEAVVNSPHRSPSIPNQETASHKDTDKPRELRIDSEKYLFIKTLGEGEMGAVWLVEHRTLRQKRAIKVVSIDATNEPGRRARFAREAQILARLVHPNAVAIYDFDIVDNLAFIEMEFLEGITLRNWINRGQSLPLEKVDWLLGEVCAVMSQAHGRGIVHRDIRPENIMILEDPGSGRHSVKVLDFGLSKLVQCLRSESTLQLPHGERPINALRYASPEQLGFAADIKLGAMIDARSDIYSIGVVLYELLVGARPFSGDVTARMGDQTYAQAPRFAEIAPEINVDPAIETVVLRCLEISPDSRPQSAGELCEQFHEAVERSRATLTPMPSKYFGCQPHSDDQGELVVDPEKYRIIRKLGDGGMGAVWLVEHIELEQKRAIKVIRADSTTDPVHLAWFEREARLLAKLVHPNAVALYDFAVVGSVAYIEMEYVEGVTLRQWINSGEHLLPLEKVDWLLREICQVMAHAHNLGIVHRDVKPENIMILNDMKPGREHVKVLDFGIAKIVRNVGNSPVPSLHPEGPVGTPHYMSPEQIGFRVARAPNGEFDHRSDIYSIGVLLYELIAGKPPFTGALTNLLHDHGCTIPPSFAKKAPDVHVDPAVETVVLKCLEKKPADRPQSARELYEHFHGAVEIARRNLANPPVANEVDDPGRIEQTLRGLIGRHEVQTPSTPLPRIGTSRPPRRRARRAAVAGIKVAASGLAVTLGLSILFNWLSQRPGYLDRQVVSLNRASEKASNVSAPITGDDRVQVQIWQDQAKLTERYPGWLIEDQFEYRRRAAEKASDAEIGYVHKGRALNYVLKVTNRSGTKMDIVCGRLLRDVTARPRASDPDPLAVAVQRQLKPGETRICGRGTVTWADVVDGPKDLTVRVTDLMTDEEIVKPYDVVFQPERLDEYIKFESRFEKAELEGVLQTCFAVYVTRKATDGVREPIYCNEIVWRIGKMQTTAGKGNLNWLMPGQMPIVFHYPAAAARQAMTWWVEVGEEKTAPQQVPQ
jgi:serine/threonine protein kinase